MTEEMAANPSTWRMVPLHRRPSWQLHQASIPTPSLRVLASPSGPSPHQEMPSVPDSSVRSASPPPHQLSPVTLCYSVQGVSGILTPILTFSDSTPCLSPLFQEVFCH